MNTPCPPQSLDGAHSRVLKIKSAPPGFIHPDHREPLLSMTPDNVDGKAEVRGTTAFVFTSTRTLRALQNQEERDHHPGHAHASISSVPSTPSSSIPLSSGTSVAPHTKAQRASLTLSQLDKHSEGAISARSLLGAKMRAAGFVDLPHSGLGQRNGGLQDATSTSPHSRRALPSTFSTAPMPRNPPDFPPVLFVKPSHVTATPLWQYQNETDSSPATKDSGRFALGSAVSSNINVRLGESAIRHRVLGASSSSSTTKSLPQRCFSPSSSHPGSESPGPLPPSSSTLLSSSSYPSLQTDGPDECGAQSRPSDSGSRSRNGKVGGWSADLDVDNHPLPTPRTSPRSRRSAGSLGSRAFTTTAYPGLAIGDTVPPIAYPSSSGPSASFLVPEVPPGSTISSCSGSSTALSSSSSLSRPPNAKSHTGLHPKRRRLSSDDKRVKAKAQSKADVPSKEPPSFSSARRLGYQHSYSFTELCDRSSFAWTSKSEVFAPSTPIARTSDVSPVAPSTSRPAMVGESVEPPSIRPTRHPRWYTKAYADASAMQGRFHRIPSAPLRSMSIVLSETGLEVEKDSQKAKVRRLKKTAEDGDQSPYTYASPDKVTKGPSTFLPVINDRVIDPRDRSSVKKRGRDTRGKVLGASESIEDRAAALA